MNALAQPTIAEPTLRHDGARYVYRCQFGQQGPAKSAGFRWDAAGKLWWTADASRAAALRNYADESTLAILNAKIEAANESLAASRATDAAVDLPVPAGLSYLPYQRAGIAYGMKRINTLIGDEMGLGKTIQAIGIYNAMLAEAGDTGGALPMLVVCPASLRLNWAREIQKWSIRPVRVGYVVTTHYPKDCDVVIINYDVLERHRERIDAQPWALLVVDECHYIKNPKTLRALALLGGKEKLPAKKIADGHCPREFRAIKADRKVFLTGTPIPNRPVELWPIAHALDPVTFSSWKQYVYRYCAAKYNGYALDTTGASNLDELQQKLRSSIMIRRLKADVLTELPPKRRQIIELPPGDALLAVKAESDCYEAIEDRLQPLRVAVEIAKAGTDAEYREAVQRLRSAVAAEFTELSKLRKEVAIAKLPQVIEHLENTEGKILVFAWHHEVIDGLVSALSKIAPTVKIDGRNDIHERQAAVDQFQTDPHTRFFVGSITAAGVGLTLTASSHVVFAELDWVPGNLSQAEDRAHRIGQRGSVLVQHIVLDGSLDARMAKVIIDKQDTIRDALDTEVAPIEAPEALTAPEPIVFEQREPATRKVTPKQIEEEAVTLTADQVEAIHAGLRALAAMDIDRAREQNGIGFNKLDTGIGCSLAERSSLTPRQAVIGLKLVNKYRRQLSPDLVARAKG